MNVVKTCLRKIGHILLSMVRILCKAICCRRKKEPEYLLPMTIGHVTDADVELSGAYELTAQWETWPEGVGSSFNHEVQKEKQEKAFHQDEAAQEDFFKDMEPQIRKPKKLYIRKDIGDSEEKQTSSNRLALDPKAILIGPDLGVIDDNPSNWEDAENSEELWDPNQLIRETKRAEREKRLAEHQRRKQEKESRRASKHDTLSNMSVLNLSDSKDKPKYS